jgi:predicted small secreted protein
MKRSAIITFALFTLTLVITGCETTTPPKTASFAKDIQPILSKHCLECHRQGGAGESASGLNLTTYQGLMKGTKFGPVVKPGDSLSSTLLILVEGRADPSIKMPHGDRPSLSKDEIDQLRNWVDQGAKDN